MEDLTILIASTFLEYRRKKQPEYRAGEGLFKAAKKAAELCKAHKLDPVKYVQVIYNRYGGVHDQFYPNILNAKEGLTLYERAAQYDQTQAHDTLFQVQLSALKKALEAGWHLDKALMDDALGFKAWFRVTITNDPIPAVMKKYQDKARKELSPNLKTFLDKLGKGGAERIANG